MPQAAIDEGQRSLRETCTLSMAVAQPALRKEPTSHRRAPGKRTAKAPTRRQVEATLAVVRWYLNLYHGTKDDPGLLPMFCDTKKVGAFSVTSTALRRGDGEALFRMLVATTMFQRRQDVQIMRVLRGISKADADELGSPRRLLKLVDNSPCIHMQSLHSLHGTCDLAKHAVTRKGRCGKNPKVDCHLKRHTVLLRRYGHFGKVPTSAALMVRETGAGSLSDLRRQVLATTADPRERAHLLEAHLSRAWRVSDKIAAMFLSALCVPDLSKGSPPWGEGIDWTRFVVIDSNVDLYLAAIGYAGASTYDGRREFVRQLAEQIDLAELRHGLRAFNPRLVQQAMYLFMSSTNRRTIGRDCMHVGADACGACPSTVARLCPVRKT